MPAWETPLPDRVIAHDAQSMLEFIAEHTSDVIVRADMQGRVAYASPSIRHYGYTPDDVLGSAGLDLLHPDDRARFAANTVAVIADAAGPHPDRLYRFRRAGGGWVWMEDNPRIVLDAAGRPREIINVFRDVTRWLEAETALRASEARYRMIAESMSDVVIQADRDGLLTYVSPSVRAYGYAPEDLIGRHADELLHPDDLSRVQANRAINLSGQPMPPPSERANRFRTANGDWVWLEGSPKLLRDDSGATVGVLNVLRDVTERRAQAELFEAAFTQAPVSMTLTGLDGRLLRVNPAACRAMGMSEDELVGLDAKDIVHPDERGADAARNDQLLKGEIESYEVERRFRRADGAYIWVRLAVSLVRNTDGSPKHFLSHGQDLTARRAAEAQARDSEARYRIIAEQTTDIIAMSDASGKISYLSPSVRQLGFRPEDLVGQTFQPHVHVEDYPRILRSLKVQAGANEPERIRWRGRHRQTGEWIWMESAPSQLLDPVSGAPIGILDVVRDVSEQVRQEEALARARAEAEAAANVKAQFLANMSHEIRTPLTAVLGFTDILGATPGLDETARGYVRRIAGAGSALLAIVNDILDFSKLEAGRVEVRPEAADIAAIAEETLSLFEARAAEKRLDLGLTLDPALPAAARLDPQRLRQILVNLVGNAVKFTDRGSVTLRVAQADGGATLRFEVTDTGPGLDTEQCARLFQRFNQIDGSTTRRHGGTGLGLAICKGLAEAMGGAVGVTSTPGTGSVFRLDLPLEAVAAAQAPGAAADATSIAGLRVLVVDDNATNRELARRILEAFGAQVTEAGGGAEALAQLAALPVDVVLMDLRMPDLDGRDVLAGLRGAGGPNRRVPVLAFTADAEVSDAAGLDAFDGVVRKPIDPMGLAAMVASAATGAATRAPAAQWAAERG